MRSKLNIQSQLIKQPLLERSLRQYPHQNEVRDPTTKRYFGGEVEVLLEKGATDAIRRLFGRDLTSTEIVNLAGAPTGSRVIIEGWTSSIRLSTYHRELLTGDQRTEVFQSSPGEPLRMLIDRVYVNPDAASGIGSRMVATQIKQAAELKIPEIDVGAAGGPGMPGTFGWILFPILGFNYKIPGGVLTAMERFNPDLLRRLNGKLDLNTLMLTAGGPEFWKQHGTGLTATFNTAEGSGSMRVLESYKKRRGIVL
jgi:hypothetical protein